MEDAIQAMSLSDYANKLIGGGDCYIDRFHNSYYRKRKNSGGMVEKDVDGESSGGKDLNNIGGSKDLE